MKKFIFIMLLGLLWSSCSNEEGIIPPSSPEKAASELRTTEEAIALADNLFASRTEGTRASSRTVKAVSIIGSASGRSASDTLIYAINYADNGGFALVSAVPEGIDIIGYADEGNFDVEKIEPGSNVEYFLDAAKNYVSARGISIGDGPIINPGNDPIYKWDRIKPVLAVEWGQNYPEGIYCPNKIAGCVQTAMAQMMSFLQAPTSISLTYTNHDIATQTLNWAEITKHTKSCSNAESTVNSHLSSCKATLESHKALGRLCRELGHRNHANYYEDATGAYTYRAYNTFTTLCPSKSFVAYKSFNSDFSNLYSDLKAKSGIAYVDGGDKGGAGAHAWVCDGGEDMQKITRYLKYDGTYEDHVEHNYCYHFNWGWNGLYNGYFNAGVFDTSKGRSRYDFSISPGFFVVYK